VQQEGEKNLDHLYSTHRDLYKTLPRPPFGKSDHHSILLIPAYKQKLKQDAPLTRSTKKWSDEADAKLQDSFASTDWNMFWDSSGGIEEYTTTVTGFINKCIDDIVPTGTICTYPNQKPWITGNIHAELPSDTSLPDELNYFYARFDASNTETCMRASAVPDDCVITLSVITCYYITLSVILFYLYLTI
jgi:hypothetical protein